MTCQRILALTDLSDCSLAGLDAAEALARRLHARVVVGFVHTRARALRGFGAGPGGEERLATWAREEDESRLRDLGPQHIEKLRLDGFEVIDGESARDGVPKLIARVRPDLVCMSTHGRSGFKHMLLGSIAEQTVRSSGVPVLVTKGAPLPRAEEPLRVMIAVDLIEEPARLLRRTAPLLRAKDALCLVHVVESYYYSPAAYGSEFALPQPDVPRLLEAAQLRLAGIAREPELPAPEMRVVTGSAGESIVTVEGEWRPHLVVSRTHGRRGFDRMMLGSVSEYLARKCRASVLVFPKEA